MSSYTPLAPERAKELLDHIDPGCSREDWILVGMALCAGLGHAVGWPLFNEWSAGAPEKFDRNEAARQWSSFDEAGNTTAGTLYHFAEQGGWKRPEGEKRERRPEVTHAQPAMDPAARRVEAGTRLPSASVEAGTTAKPSEDAVPLSESTYVCCDVDGKVVAAQRIERMSDGDKRVRWWKPAKGQPEDTPLAALKWVKSKGTRSNTVPFYNSELLGGDEAANIDHIIIVEGPKVAAELQKHLDAQKSDLRVVVLGTMTGAQVKRPAMPEVVAPVVKLGKPILTWADNDTDGIRHMVKLGDILIGASATDVKAIKWPAAPVKGDAADWVEAGATPPLVDLIADAQPLEHSKIRRQKAAGIDDAFEEAHPEIAKRRKAALFETSGGRLAQRLLTDHADETLIVVDGRTVGGSARSTIATLGPTGVWEMGRGDRRLRRWLSDLATKLIALAAEVCIEDEIRSVINKLTQIDGRASIFHEIQDQAAAAHDTLIGTGELQHGVVQVCTRADLDADTRYLGTASGVVDLHTGKLLDPAEGRKHLVTCAAPTKFVPDAKHPDVDNLLRFLDPVVADYVWQSLAYSLQGRPSRRFYLVQGPPGGGKTVLVNAVVATLGVDLATQPQDKALQAPTGSAGLSPENEKFMSPARFAFISEPTVNTISPSLLKKRAGDEQQTWRNPYGAEQTAWCTASQWILCNPATAPRLATRDEALVERMRVLPWGAIPESEQDPSLHDRVGTDTTFHEAMLAHLVRLSATLTPGKPPAAPRAVEEATLTHAERNLSEFVLYSRRIVLAPESTLLIDEAWAGWCDFCGMESGAVEAGGIKRSGIAKALRQAVDDLPAAKNHRVGKSTKRGWSGWRLLSDEEVLSTQEAEEEAVRSAAAQAPAAEVVESAAPVAAQEPEAVESAEAAQAPAAEAVEASPAAAQEAEPKPQKLTDVDFEKLWQAARKGGPTKVDYGELVRAVMSRGQAKGETEIIEITTVSFDRIAKDGPHDMTPEDEAPPHPTLFNDETPQPSAPPSAKPQSPSAPPNTDRYSRRGGRLTPDEINKMMEDVG